MSNAARRSEKAVKAKARALLVLGVLLSLCASDNVGPRLLPLPVSAESAAAARQLDQGESAARAPSRGRAFRARVEMAQAPKSRAGAGRQLTHAAATPKLGLTKPPAARHPRGGPYSPVGESSADYSRPGGRAPPQPA
jgi:hypothetical protein